MRVAVLVKQVPVVESLALGPGGRLRRQGVALEMNAFCRRAVSKGVELAGVGDGSCTVVTVGPPSAEDVLREAVAFGAARGVLVTDPAMAGSDTLATARAAAAALGRLGPFDLVLVGRNSVDADTGQVGPEVAELLGLPFVGAARELTVLDGGTALEIRSERDSGWRRARVTLPAVVSVAERLTDPCKMPPEARRAVPADRIVRLGAGDLGPGPWGQAGSPTRVGGVRAVAVDRARVRLTGPVEGQARDALAVLADRGLVIGDACVRPGDGPSARSTDGAARHRLGASPETMADGHRGDGGVAGDEGVVPASAGGDGPVTAVIVEPGAPGPARELLGEAAVLARAVAGRVVVVGPDPGDPTVLSGWGADEVWTLAGTTVEEDVAAVLAERWGADRPWAVLAPASAWGREVAGRLAARLGAGLTGDAVGIGVRGGRVVFAKPAFGGQLLAEVTADGVPQMATVRAGVLVRRRPRPASRPASGTTVPGRSAGRVVVLDEAGHDDQGVLVSAPAVVVVGQGVDPTDYPLLDPLVEVLGAAVGATRKVTDRGWMPRSRQIGVTGHSVAPAVLVLVGVSGSVNHVMASRGSGTVVAINHDPAAAVFDWSDVGLVADWREAVPALAAALAPPPVGAHRAGPSASAASTSDRGTPSR